ncbi:MAG: tyrosine-type recombinase/integrase [Rhizobiaceae bacterium]
MPLSETTCRKSAGIEGRVRKLSDGGGLQLWLMPTGSRLWRFAYRFDRKQKLLSIGPYPLISLAAAREARDAAKRQLLAGIDPSEMKRQSRAEKDTFDRLSADYVQKLKREGRADATIAKVEWLFSLASPKLGQKPVREIVARDVLELLQTIEAKSHFETAQRVRSTIGSAFRFAIASERADRDPTYALRGALARVKVTHRAAITDIDGFGKLLRAIEGYKGQPTTKLALQLMSMMFPRPGELRLALWHEFNVEKAVWEVPADRAKMRRPHRVPLSTQALSLLEDLRAHSRGTGDLLFPSGTDAAKPMSENTMNSALRRLGYGPDLATAHGFRATASTILNESKQWSSDAIERQLAHVEEDDVRRAYARGEYWEERVRMMQWWGDLVEHLRCGRLDL